MSRCTVASTVYIALEGAQFFLGREKEAMEGSTHPLQVTHPKISCCLNTPTKLDIYCTCQSWKMCVHNVFSFIFSIPNPTTTTTYPVMVFCEWKKGGPPHLKHMRTLYQGAWWVKKQQNDLHQVHPVQVKAGGGSKSSWVNLHQVQTDAESVMQVGGQFEFGEFKTNICFLRWTFLLLTLRCCLFLSTELVSLTMANVAIAMAMAMWPQRMHSNKSGNWPLYQTLLVSFMKRWFYVLSVHTPTQTTNSLLLLTLSHFAEPYIW